MNKAEFDKLLVPSINPLTRSLYLALSSMADYQTGIVSMSYSSMADLIRFEPPFKSKSDPINPTQKQIIVMLEILERAELITKITTGSASKGEAAKWEITEIKKGTYQGHIKTQSHQGLQADEGHISGAQEGHIQGHKEGHTETQTHQGLQADEGHKEGYKEGHLSLKDIKELKNKNIFTQGDQPVVMAEELTLTPQFKNMVKTVGLVGFNDDQIQAMFIQFASHPNNRHKAKLLTDWLADWRGWCAKARVYNANAKGNQYGKNNQPSGSGFGGKTKTADILAYARKVAEQDGDYEF